MLATADSEGEEAAFLFALPVQVEWADSLASITLSGPDGLASIDESTDRPMAILRDPQNGQVRGFLTDLPVGDSARTVADETTTARPGLELRFSRGIPDSEDWTR